MVCRSKRILDFGRLQPRLLCRWGRVELGGRAASRGQQVTVDLKSKQRPMRESSAPAIPPVCSQPPPPLYRLKETPLQSAAEASPSSEVREDAVWWQQRGRCQDNRRALRKPLGTVPRHRRLLGPWRLVLSPTGAQGVSLSPLDREFRLPGRSCSSAASGSPCPCLVRSS